MEGEAETGTFAQTLATLKRHGSGLLVVGATCDGTHLDISRRLLGADASTRRRVVVITDGVGDASDRVAGTDTDTRVIERQMLTRGAATADAPATPIDLPRLTGEIRQAVEELGAAGLGPAELRLCLDSLRPIVDDHGVVGTRRFLEDVLGIVREHHGMAHVHLPVDPDHPTVAGLEAVFEAVIELRPGEQRWRVVDEGVRTEWLPVDA